MEQTPDFEGNADAFDVKLEAFEGPLDLLLHLIKTHELNIHNIPIALITRQYLDAIALMQELNLEPAEHRQRRDGTGRARRVAAHHDALARRERHVDDVADRRPVRHEHDPLAAPQRSDEAAHLGRLSFGVAAVFEDVCQRRPIAAAAKGELRRVARAAPGRMAHFRRAQFLLGEPLADALGVGHTDIVQIALARAIGEAPARRIADARSRLRMAHQDRDAALAQLGEQR